ncbi:hepatoma-derived growth factor-related protein 2-like isoform X1 [Vespa mandarinia]|uniref:hepatoma-derived growth factor-related protein 2-like isoform X1 n=2 Tax=Vespa mandarinia TaxID=7446 RepID=UPI001615B97C|nr:hepatoma-derived growth factor-related protein 2-like isoform X1 [Vespa mandarinia]XP_035729315.1 hepatoma-derived growth factor-related protein 2-like isoform X1 [Vespa mandarinia]
MMNARTTLVEQKRIQWAKEKEEMARLGGNWGTLKHNDTICTTVRTYATGSRLSLIDSKDKQISSQPFRATSHYGNNVNLKALSTDCTGNVTTNLKSFDYSSGSLINLNDHREISRIRRRSPSLPPIYNKDQQQYLYQEQRRDFDGKESHYHQFHKPQKQSQQQDRSNDRHENQNESLHHYGLLGEEREGETSGYASDSIDVPLPESRRLIPGCKDSETDTMERTWQNPYYTTPDNSLPSSRRLLDGRAGELINRPRWGSIWGQDSVKGDPPPPPSWLSRLDQSSQVLVINHDSASSPDSSTTGSTGSETTKTYLRGQNIPVDANILQEREVRRQKALELQNAIKQQLEEKDRQRKEEKARRLREEQLEEERIKRERDKEKERFEEEQRKLKEKEEAKLKKAEAMREILQAAENSAKEEKKNRRKRIEMEETMLNPSSKDYEFKTKQYTVKNCTDDKSQEHLDNCCNESQISKDAKEISEKKINHEKEKIVHMEKSKGTMEEINSVQVPISKDVAIVLSGRLEDSELLKKANLQLVNLVVTPSPRKSENESVLSLGLDVLMKNLGSPILAKSSSKISPTITENRLLTPSKYRMTSGRDFGTQTDIESDLQDIREKIQESSTKDGSIKERKDTTNANRRDVEKSTNVYQAEELPTKTFARSKSQPRPSIESRPRWNANRPGTRYRTQSEKDPHYQRRLRLRKHQVESSDEGSRSPSLDRRKPINAKIKMRNSIRRKLKVDSYNADLSIDSLNSIVPLRIDRNGKINIETSPNDRNHKHLLDINHMNEIKEKPENKQSNIWCGREILEKLNSLRNGLLMKQIEWDPDRSLVSPTTSEIF